MNAAKLQQSGNNEEEEIEQATSTIRGGKLFKICE